MKLSDAKHRACAKQQKVGSRNRRGEQCSKSINSVMVDGITVEIELIGKLLENGTNAASKEIETDNNDPPLIDKSPTTQIEPTGNTNEELTAIRNEPFIPHYMLTVTEDEMDDDDDTEDVEPDKGIPPKRVAFSCSHNTASEESAKVNHSETISEVSVINNPANIPTPISNTNEELADISNESCYPAYIFTVTEEEMDDDDYDADAEDVEPEKGIPIKRAAFSCSHNTTPEESAIVNHSETISAVSVINNPANIPTPISNTNVELASNSNASCYPAYIFTVTEDEMDDDDYDADAEDVEPEKGIPLKRAAFSCSHNTASEESAIVNHSETISAVSVINNPANIPTPISNTNEELAAISNESCYPAYIFTVTEDEMDDDDEAKMSGRVKKKKLKL